MANDLIEYSVERAFDPDSRYAPKDGSAPVDSNYNKHPLDSEEMRAVLSKVENFWAEARDLHAENRAQQMIDADYRDGNQWKEEDAMVLMERGQAPLVVPLVKQMVDWVKGTERRTRIDWNVLPRSDEDVDMASLKKELLKYVSDVNRAGWERSQAFGDAVDVGVGWIEDCYNNDKFEEPVTSRYQDWKGMWWDPYSRSLTLRDARYLLRAKYLDLDYGAAMFPDRAKELASKACDYLDPQLEQLDLENRMPQMFYNGGNTARLANTTNSGTFSISGTALMSRRTRPRFLAIECWYRVPVNAKLMTGDIDFNGKVYDAANAGMKQAVDSGAVSLVDGVSEEMHLAIFTPGLLLSNRKSPYKHGRFPFTPIWAYRRHRDGMPYGLIRQARDVQDEYNKRRSKALYLLSTNRILYESDAFDEKDADNQLEEARRPDGEVRLKPGALRDKKLEIQTHTGLVAAEIELMGEAKNNIYESSGVTRENIGQESNAISGRAILAKQQQGAVTTAEVFDNYRLAIQESGGKNLSNVEQFMSMPKQFRILGPDGTAKFITANEPDLDPVTGEVIFNNDVTKSEADFIVDQMDYRETVRMAMSEQMFDSLKNQPPEIQLKLLDLAFEMTDLPNKAAIAQRIRALSGEPEPGQEKDPAYIAAKDKAKADAEQRQRDEDENLRADTRTKNAQADKYTADATMSRVAGHGKALETAGMLEAAVPLAPTADRLLSTPQPQAAAEPPPQTL